MRIALSICSLAANATWCISQAKTEIIHHNMLFLNHCNDAIPFRLLLLAILGCACSHAYIELTEEYLNDIKADEKAEVKAGEYNYDHQGDDWQGTCKDGNRQSPIDLIYDDAVVSSIPRIRFKNYDRSLQTPLVLVNNGHTANLVLPATIGGQRASISGGLLPGMFEAQSVHLHWGSALSKGSEHAINFERYDIEMHIVHKNRKYGSISEASENWDGLAVLGVMFRSTRRPLSTQYGLNKIFNQLPRITQYQSNATIQGVLTVGQLLGNIVTGEFYSYNGSLTTPDCAESVTWTVFKDTINYSDRQIQKLWSLKDSRQQPLINNYRSLQDVYNRTVYYRSVN